MSNQPIKTGHRRVQHPASSEAPDVVIHEERESTDTSGSASPWFSFSYSYSEISLHGGTARVKSRKTQLENGKLTSEAFEGTLGAGAYHAAVRQTEDLFVRQTQLLLDSFSRFFLPWSRKRD